jgi:hypothetical protein
MKTPPPCPTDVLTALLACHVPYPIAVKMRNKNRFPITSYKARSYDQIGNQRLAYMWDAGLLLDDPTLKTPPIELSVAQLQARTRALTKNRQYEVERQLGVLEARKTRLLTELEFLKEQLKEPTKKE